MDFRSNFVSQNTTELKSVITAVFLAMIPGFVGFGILITAIAIADWYDSTTASGSSLQIQNFGLFHVCKKQINNPGLTTKGIENRCYTLEEEAALKGQSISNLEQATRSLMIISVIIHIPAIVTAIYFGLRRNKREKGAIIPGVIFLVAAVCAISGMGCYAAFLVDQMKQSEENTAAYSVAEPGISFLIGWFGTVCAIISCITCFVSHAIN